jgi:hypothetical protein
MAESSEKPNPTEEKPLLGRAMVPAAATAVLIGAAGAATLRRTRKPKSRVGRLLKKAPLGPVLAAAGVGARKLKKRMSAN